MAHKLLHVVALGCAKNRVDVETVVARAAQRGFTLTADPGAADVLLLATCGFITAAAQESINTALELDQVRRTGARLVVAGCLSQRFGGELAQALPEADAVVGTADLDRIVEAIAGGGPSVDVGEPGADISYTPSRRPLGKPGTAYLKVSDGCSRRCAFCTIPSIRGPHRSRSIEEICEEAQTLAAQGVLELNLVAQDLSSFGRDRGETLEELFRALSAVEGIRWIRPLYLYPDQRLRDVMRLMAKTPRIVPYLDLPIQHASDAILARMKRGHRSELLQQLLFDAREIIPELFVRTTVIVGHPGETREDFETLLNFIQRYGFDHLGAFRYSPEEGTASFEQTDSVSARDSYNRYRKVMATQRRISRARCRQLRGRELDVLVEGPSEDSPMVYVGRHAGQAPEVDGVVYLDQPIEPGKMVSVLISESSDYDLYGEVQRIYP